MSATTHQTYTGHEPLPHLVSGSKGTGYWGIVMLLLIESVVFAGLISSYFYLFARADVWPPTGASAPELGLPIIYSIVLLGSGVLGHLGNRAIKDGDVRRMRMLRIAGCVALVAFMVMKAYEYLNLDYQWNDSAYTSILWLIAGFHTLHVFTVLLKESVIQVLAAKGFFNQERRGAIEGATLYWNFVVLMWIPLFVTVYIFPNYV